MIDNVINCIDDRINIKRTGYYGNFLGSTYHPEEYAGATGGAGNYNNTMYGHSKN